MNELEIYHTPNGIIKKLDTLKGKRALVGDDTASSFFNTKMVLDSLGIEYEIISSIDEIIDKLQNISNYDIIFTNNIYRNGDTGTKLLQKLKAINGFNIPIVIHTISNNTNNNFIKLGFDSYLKKPIKQDETIQLFKNLHL